MTDIHSTLDEKDSEKYKLKELKEHILELPDTYIGSIIPCKLESVWVAESNDGDHPTFINKDITISIGLYKIFDEILVNACDMITRTRMNFKSDESIKITKKIKVNISEHEISIYNDGDGIPIVVHNEHNVYIPEMIFGMLLTSGNYNKNEEKLVGGKNGYGAKLTNLFSSFFEIETIDHRRKKKYIQSWTNNMNDATKPVITNCSNNPYTKITFRPDFQRFSMEQFSQDEIAFMKRRVYDVAGCSPSDVSVFLNDEKINVKTFEQYCKLYLTTDSRKYIYEKPNERWEVLVCPSRDGAFQQISFVNYINTIDGGKHVEHVVNQMINNGNKAGIEPKFIKNNMFVFVHCFIVNPSFSSQSKTTLTSSIKTFGSRCDLSDTFYTKFDKSEIMKLAKGFKEFSEKQKLSKTDGRKCRTVRVSKLEDAEYAGSNQSHKCTLIITEGDSAKSTAMSGLKIIGNKYFGIFPIKGKLLNVRDSSMDIIQKNKEIEDLKKIIGLKQGEKYKDLSQLRYGKLMLFTDPDLDGAHIKGLLINFIHTFWPELLYLGFVISMCTPIIKVNGTEEFYSIQSFQKWNEKNSKRATIKYYKGLGTFVDEEAHQIFEKFKTCEYTLSDIDNNYIDLAFNKHRAHDRKLWLKEYDSSNILDLDNSRISMSEFIHKDLIHFSNYDNIRSVPSIMDGFKPSQRKVLFGMMKKNIITDKKLSQVQGAISELTHYHHGEQSMVLTIVGMAQNFVGSNNINLLVPSGQFGTRVEGGDDHASARYIFTRLDPIVPFIFRKEDESLLKYDVVEGDSVEPVFYVPIIPFVLVNGAHGIGTGFSTKIPCFNPRDIIQTLKMILKGETQGLQKCLKPWYRHFKGCIRKEGRKYVTEGIYSVENNIVSIKELPVGVWTTKYEELLNKLVDNGTIIDYKKANTNTDIDFTVYLKPKIQFDAKMFKLVESLSSGMTNMHAFAFNNKIHKYKSVDEILYDFIKVRYIFYKVRRQASLNAYSMEYKTLSQKILFIQKVPTMDLLNRRDDEIYEMMKMHFEPDPSLCKIKIDVDLLHDAEFIEKCRYDENLYNKVFMDVKEWKGDCSDYDYLLNMPFKSLSGEKLVQYINKLNNVKQKYGELKEKSVSELWISELEELEKKMI